MGLDVCVCVCVCLCVSLGLENNVASQARLDPAASGVNEPVPFSEQLSNVPADKRMTRQPRLPGAYRLSATCQARPSLLWPRMPLGALAKWACLLVCNSTTQKGLLSCGP